MVKPDGAVVLFGVEPFSSRLRLSNAKDYRYDWVWRKNTVVGFANAKRRPLRNIEHISVFYKRQPTYNPQGLADCDITHTNYRARGVSASTLQGGNGFRTLHFTQKQTNYPRQVLEFSADRGLHVTQKPVALCEYLVRTYTNTGETVLDCCMGSGTTGVACANAGRDFIGIELDGAYFDAAKARIEALK
jgi:site-specific DNA-methyltransferase (adenine-specific)